MSNAQIIGGVVGAAAGFVISGFNPAGALYGFTLGYSLASALFPPDIPSPPASNRDFSVTKATEGVPVPVVIGRRYVDGNIIYFDPHVKISAIKESITGDSGVPAGSSAGGKGGKSGSPPVGTKALTAIHFLLSMGKLVQLHKVMDGKSRDWLSFNTKAKGSALQISTKDSEIQFAYGAVTTTEAIEASTNAAPIVITIVNHGFGTGDSILIQNHLVNTNANGTWAITVLTPNTFSLNTSVGNGAGIATGTASKTVNKISPKYNGITTAFSSKFFCGENVSAMTPLKFDIRMEADNTIGDPISGVPVGRIDTDTVDTPLGVNPANVYWMIFTNTQWAVGLPSTVLDLTSFQAAYTIFKNEGTYIEPLIDALTGAKDLLELLNFHTRSILRVNDLGKVELYPLRQNNYTPIVVPENDLLNINVGTKTWKATSNEFFASFPDRNLKYTERTIKEKNEAAIQQIGGERKSVTYQFPWFTTLGLAARRLTELKNEGSYPDSALKFTLSSRFHYLRIGDVISITSTKYGFNNTLFRVGRQKAPDLGKIGVEIEAALEVAAIYSPAYVTPPGSQWKPGPNTAVDPIDVMALASYWKSRISFPDTEGDVNKVKAGKAGKGFLTSVFANRGSNLDPSFIAKMIGDVELNLPTSSPGSTLVPIWGFRFVLQTTIDADDYSFVGPKTLDLLFQGFAGQVFDIDQQDGVGTINPNYYYQWETSVWVMIIGGKEVCRWRNYTNVGSNVYRFSGIVRAANKEYPLAWAIGTEVWIAPLEEHTRPAAIPYDSWLFRQNYISQFDYDLGAGTRKRFKAYAQSIFHLGEVQDETDGITVVFLDDDDPADVGRRTNLYSSSLERESQLAPFPAAQAWKKGDTPDQEFRSWYSPTSAPSAGDWVVEFQPQKQTDDNGIGDALYFDTASPLDPDLIPDGVLVIGTDSAYNTIAQDASYGTSALKLEVFGPTVPTTVLMTKTITLNHAPAAQWPNFLFTTADMTTIQGTDAAVNNTNVVFKVSLKSTSQDAYNRARKVKKLGPAYF